MNGARSSADATMAQVASSNTDIRHAAADSNSNSDASGLSASEPESDHSPGDPTSRSLTQTPRSSESVSDDARETKNDDTDEADPNSKSNSAIQGHSGEPSVPSASENKSDHSSGEALGLSASGTESDHSSDATRQSSPQSPTTHYPLGDDAEETQEEDAYDTNAAVGSPQPTTPDSTSAVDGSSTNGNPFADYDPSHYAVLDYMHGGRSHSDLSAAELERKADLLRIIGPRARNYPHDLIIWLVQIAGLQLHDCWNLALALSAHMLTYQELCTVQPGDWKNGDGVQKLVAKSVERVVEWNNAMIEAAKRADRERGFVWWLPGLPVVPMLQTPPPGSLRHRRKIDDKKRLQQPAEAGPTTIGDSIMPYVTYTTDPDIYPDDVISRIAGKNFLSAGSTGMLRNLLAVYHVDPVLLCQSRYENLHADEWHLTQTESTLLFALRATFVAQHQHEFSDRPRRKKGEATIVYRDGLVPVLQQPVGLWSRRRLGVKAEGVVRHKFRALGGMGAGHHNTGYALACVLLFLTYIIVRRKAVGEDSKSRHADPVLPIDAGKKRHRNGEVLEASAKRRRPV